MGEVPRGEERLDVRVLNGTLIVLFCSLVLAGCDQDKIKQLQDENAALKQTLQAANLDLQAKCSTAARTYVDENWHLTPELHTTMFDYQSHYNDEHNKCFVSIQWNYEEKGTTWNGTGQIFDAYSREKYADFAERHTWVDAKAVDRVLTCAVWGKTCKSEKEYGELITPLMSK